MIFHFNFMTFLKLRWALRFIYLNVSFSAVASSAIGLVWSHGSLTASRQIHDALLENVIKAPMFFFDKTPLGRIMGRCECMMMRQLA